MKRIILALLLLAVVASCKTEHKTAVERKLDEYARVKIPAPDLSGISDNGKEVLNLYKFAADQVDSIYWRQAFGDRALMDGLGDANLKKYALINYGPWDRLDGKPFIEEYGERPLGANFYPVDMTQEEFDTFADSAKTSPYTMIRRNAAGQLQSVWYHDFFAGNIAKISSFLKAAADITIKPSVRNYLLKKIDALQSDNYYESDLAWLEMTDSKMDLVLGPNEVNDDQLYGLKASYDAYVLLKDLKRTEELGKFSSMLPELQRMLPCDEAFKSFVPGTESNVFACDEIYAGGHANAGIKLIAINLPYDARVQAERGTRTILLGNVMREKFNRLVSPTGDVVLSRDQLPNLDVDAFYWNIAFREIAHGLGVKQTVTGKGTVAEALGNKAMTWEDAKANVVGLYLVCKLLDAHKIPSLISKEDAITTFVVNLIRSERFGVGESLGRAYILIYNYLYEKEAFQRGASGKYSIDYARTLAAVESLAQTILTIQATGDYEAAAAFEKKYGSLSGTYKADLVNLRLEKIPVDIEFQFEK